MSEDVSSQVRLGATIILVAALIAAVLSLMVVAQTILSNGLSTLQAGVDQISTQEYEKYNGKKLSGTDVKAALSLYSGKDVCIIIRTTACIDGSARSGVYNSSSNTYDAAAGDYVWGYMYGTLLAINGTDGPVKTTRSEIDNGVYYIAGVFDNKQTYLHKSNSTPAVYSDIYTPSKNPTDAERRVAIYRNQGEANYTSYLWTQNEVVQVNYETGNITKVGHDEYVLDSARFRSSLVKTPGGSIIGILFEQIN